jgi:hypothetical protein
MFSVFKKLGIEVPVFGEEQDIMFFVRHVDHIMKNRHNNKDIHVSV